jgi:Fe-S cluster assembly iron-binding protein IscA
MLTVTDKAAQFMREKLDQKEEGLPEALRIVQTEDGFQLTLDNAKDGDHVIEQEGQNILLVDSAVGEALEEATLDLQESAQGASLVLTAVPPSPPAPQEPPTGEPPIS